MGNPKMVRIKGGGGDTAKRRAGDELLGVARRLKPELRALTRSARRYHRLLDPEVSDDEVELLASPEADLLGSLECLLNSDLAPVVRKLAEVEAYFRGRRSRRKRSGQGSSHV
jgi:hypothetical protein